MTFMILVLPGAIVAYVMLLRPLLSRVTAFKEFYAEADGFWAKAWAWCGNSFTILWAKVVGGVGAAMELIDPLASSLGDPDLKSQVTNVLQTNPKVLGYVMMGISVVTILARVRSLGKS